MFSHVEIFVSWNVEMISRTDFSQISHPVLNSKNEVACVSIVEKKKKLSKIRKAAPTFEQAESDRHANGTWL
jgi:hypothetical protein